MYRLIYSEFWKDPKISEEFTPEDKLFFAYLLTNPSTTSCGIYSIAKKQMAFDIGYSMESINSLMKRFINRDIIRYNEDTRELAVKNWGKYNLKKGGKPVVDCLISELLKVKDKSLIGYVAEHINNASVGIKDMYISFAKGEEFKDYKQFADIRESLIDIESTTRERHVDKTKTKTITITEPYTKPYTETCNETNTNTNTNKDSICCNSNIKIYKLYEKCGFGLLNAILIEFLDDDIETYGEKWVADAIRESTRRNKFSLKYVEGILKNWKCNGRRDSSEFAGNNEFNNTESQKHIHDGYDFSRFYIEETGEPIEDIETEY